MAVIDHDIVYHDIKEVHRIKFIFDNEEPPTIEEVKEEAYRIALEEYGLDYEPFFTAKDLLCIKSEPGKHVVYLTFENRFSES